MKINHQNKNPYYEFIKDFTFGGLSGVISKTVSAPLERIKLLIQTQNSNESLKNKKYTGWTNCFLRIYKEEGIKSYWNGNLANVIRYFPTMAFNFGFKDYFSRKFQKIDSVNNPKKFLLQKMLIGGLAGNCTMCIVYPLDFARTRLGVDVANNKGKKEFSSLKNIFSTIYKKNGISGFYQGFPMTLISNFTYRGMFFGFYDAGKKFITNYDELNIFYKFLFAQIVSSTSETINYPTDTIRRSMMMNSGLEKKIYKNSFDCIKKIFKIDGVKGFYRGCYSSMIRSTSSSLVLILYDEFQNSMKKSK